MHTLFCAQQVKCIRRTVDVRRIPDTVEYKYIHWQLAVRTVFRHIMVAFET